ncbi:MAG TPA: RNA polymerase sigma factor [Gemmataceae bacterium]|nr:RNA polymerase sigma factor [Gemmataceae bacterium]
MADDDATLVRRCRRNDPLAVRVLVERFQGAVFGLCVRLLGHRHDAEDVSQEVFLRVFRSLGSWDATRPLKPWVLSIAVNRCRTWLAKRARRPELADYLHDTAAAPPADDSVELTREIEQALTSLRPEYRSVFVRFHQQGQPYDVIAAAVRRPVGTVKTWLHRARLELLEALRRRGMVEPPAGKSSPVAGLSEAGLTEASSRRR